MVIGVSNDGATLFARSLGDGVYRSVDKGETWEEIRDLNISGEGANAISGTGRGQTVLIANNRIYRSPDNGKTWELSSGNWSETGGIYVLAASDSKIFAGTESNGVLVSTDDGLTWTPANKNIENANIRALAIEGNKILATTKGRDGGAVISTDGGKTWIPAFHSGEKSLPPGEYASAAIYGGALFVGHSGNHLPAGHPGYGVYFSNDDGRTWTEISEELIGSALPLRVHILLATSTGILAGTEQSVFRLGTDGQIWAPANGFTPEVGLKSKFINALLVNGKDILAGTPGMGIFRSPDQGERWEQKNLASLPNANVQALAANDRTIFAGTFGDGIYRSNDGGNTWAEFNAGLANKNVNALVIRGDYLYAGTDKGVYRASVVGASWMPVSNGLGEASVMSLMISDNTLYAGTGTGVFQLSDADIWENTNLTAQSVLALTAVNKGILAGTETSGVFHYDAEKKIWRQSNGGLPPTLYVSCFAVDGEKIYAGSIFGVFRSTDQGQSWKQVNAGLLDTAVTSLAIIKINEGSKLIAGTRLGGVFISPIP